MKKQNVNIENIPAIIYGDTSDKIYLFIHGKCGYKEEAEEFAQIVTPKGYQVLSIDLPEHGERKQEKNTFDPWHVKPELQSVMAYMKTKWKHISLRANSIGAWFCMLSFGDIDIKKCLFVSPILDMNKLISDMMVWANVSAEQLMQEQEIPTEFGETLSWKYLMYVRENPIKEWNSPTAILYAQKDNMTDKATVDSFVQKHKCKLEVMVDGEHWFHTPKQLAVLRQWEIKNYE